MTALSLSHDDLVAIAARWLRKSYPVVLTEVSGGWSYGESPDALAFSRQLVCAGDEIGHHLPRWYFQRHKPPTAYRRAPIGCMPIYADEQVETVVVEAKASLSDFHTDRRKPFRKCPEQGMGTKRYYLCPEGLIDPKRHDLNGWGLLYARTRDGPGYRHPGLVVPSDDFWPKADARETALLVKWACVVEMATGQQHGEVWGSKWKRELVERIHAAQPPAVAQ